MFMRILSSIMSIFIFLLSVLGIRTTRDTGDFDNKDWMSDISDNKYLSEITIPGTHDSCAHYEPVYGMIKCQKYTLKDQLEMGVRFLDVRAGLFLNKMIILHEILPQSATLDDVLETCYDFLKENPSETVIMSLKQEAGENREEFIECVEKIVSDNEDMWYIENEIPTLAQVRGKIVLMNRYEKAETDFGLSTHYWVSNEAFSVNNESFNLHVQDYYCVEDGLDYKWSLVENQYAQSVLMSDKDNLYINFTSAYIDEIPNIVKVKDYINPLLIEYLKNAPDGCYGITAVDFITPELCDLLIDKNI